MEVRRPADHVELVYIAEAVHVATRVEQGAHRIEMAAGGSPVQRGGVVARFAGIGIGAVLEQETHRPDLSVPRGRVQRSPSAVRLISICRLNERRVSGDEGAQALDVTLGAGG